MLDVDKSYVEKLSTVKGRGVVREEGAEARVAETCGKMFQTRLT